MRASEAELVPSHVPPENEAAAAPAPRPHPVAEAATRVALLSASALLAFMLGLEIVAAFGFFVRIPIGPAHLPIAVAFAVAASAVVAHRLFGWRVGVPVLAAVLAVETALIVVAVLASGAIYDVSYDGQTYQQEGVIQLTRGWVPLTGDEDLGKNSLWVAHYAKGPWMQEAALYRVLGRIEGAKAFNWLLIVTAFAASLALLLALLPHAPVSAVALAAIIALNPVALAQATAFYVDGQSASLLTVILASACLLLSRRHGDWVPLAVLAAATVLLVNVKATGLAYALVLLLGAVLFLLLGQTPRLSSRTVIAVFALAVAFGAGVVGFNPYVTNTIDHGTPLYPLTGSIDIMTPNTPANLVGKDRFTRMFTATFSRSENAYGARKTTLKLPYEVSKSEVEIFGAPDVRAAGFGPLFACVAILSVVTALLARRRRDEIDSRGPERQALVLAALIAISVLATAEGWWARYAPQLWLLPAITVAVALLRRGFSLAGVAGRLLCVLIAADIALVGYGSISHQVQASAEMRRALTKLAARGPVRVQFGAFESNRVRLSEAGVRFTAAPPSLTTGGEPLAFSEAVVFPPK